ncbi:hypothetical protein ACSZM9_09620 [Aeromonas hydrophila]|uniref:hypothetical protein n=1 Tax=Aeromonas hydrophila TaxID=644 RepID=UPI003EC86F34
MSIARGAFFISATLLFSATLYAEQGVWVKNKNFAQMHTACVQTWTCSPKQAVIHSPETTIKVTKPAYTMGVCNAGDGPIDGCNECAANEPKELCNWSLEKAPTKKSQ